MVSLPARPVGAALVAAVLAVAGLLAGYELLLRQRGFMPSVQDRIDVWARERRRIGEDYDLVLLGSSRFRHALVPSVLETELPGWRVINLALDGTSPLPVLHELAGDPDFHGTVLCEVHPRLVFDPWGTPVGDRDWAERWRHLPWISRLETPMRMWLQARLAFALPAANLEAQVRAAVRGQALHYPPSTVRMDASRHVFRDFSTSDVASAERDWVKRLRDARPASPAQHQRQIEAVLADVDAIRARGGAVIFVRPSSDGAVRQTEDELWPEEDFWQPLVRNRPALHFRDSAVLAAFDCPDGSHIDGKDADAYSHALAGELKRRGLLAPR